MSRANDTTASQKRLSYDPYRLCLPRGRRDHAGSERALRGH